MMDTGRHLMVDGLTAAPPTVGQVREFLTEAVQRVKLQVIAGPFFFELAAYSEAWAIVAESHVAIKWWPGGLVLVDLFSCKPFNTEGLISFIVETFGLEHWRPRVIQRMGVG